MPSWEDGPDGWNACLEFDLGGKGMRQIKVHLTNLWTLMDRITASYSKSGEWWDPVDADGRKFGAFEWCKQRIDDIREIPETAEWRIGDAAKDVREFDAYVEHKMAEYKFYNADLSSILHFVSENSLLTAVRDGLNPDTQHTSWSRLTERLVYNESVLGEAYENSMRPKEALAAYKRARAFFDDNKYNHRGDGMAHLWARQAALEANANIGPAAQIPNVILPPAPFAPPAALAPPAAAAAAAAAPAHHAAPVAAAPKKKRAKLEKAPAAPAVAPGLPAAAAVAAVGAEAVAEAKAPAAAAAAARRTTRPSRRNHAA